MAIFPQPHFLPNHLVALEDASGFTRGLGIVRENDFRGRQVTLHTPLESLEGADALRLGNLTLDPATFRDARLW